MKDGGNGIALSESFVQPFQAVVAPILHLPARFDAVHIIVASGKNDANGTDLFVADFSFYPGIVDAFNVLRQLKGGSL